MNKQTKALKMAIEALDDIELCDYQTQQKALKACKEALEQPAQEYLTRAQQVIRANNSAQEPVAYILRNEYNEYRLEPMDNLKITDFPVEVEVKLYTHPAPSCSCKDKK